MLIIAASTLTPEHQIGLEHQIVPRQSVFLIHHSGNLGRYWSRTKLYLLLRNVELTKHYRTFIKSYSHNLLSNFSRWIKISSLIFSFKKINVIQVKRSVLVSAGNSQLHYTFIVKPLDSKWWRKSFDIRVF